MAALAIVSSNLPSSAVGSSYSAKLEAQGGVPNYMWSVVAGNLPSGLSLAAKTGEIVGVPASTGTSSFTVAVQDQSKPSQAVTMPMSISAVAPLSIASPGFSAGKVGSAYTAKLQAQGGTPNYTWSVVSGNLPAGLTLGASTGVISGVPTADGTANFVAQVKDQGNPVQTSSLRLSINVTGPPLSLSVPNLPTSTVGASYSAKFQAQGGVPTYTWSIALGKLPAGLTLSPTTGAISGTSTSIGASVFVIQVKDQSSPSQSMIMPVTINTVAPLAFAASSVPTSKVGSSYSAKLQAQGGTPGYTWSIASGSLPAGLSLANSGTISGVPTNGGTSNFTVQVKDQSNPGQAITLPLSINVITPLTLSGSLTSGVTAKSYSGALSASGGTPSYIWSIASGNLPAGLTLSTTTGAISGTPGASGASSFTVQVKDQGNPSQIATLPVSLNVIAPLAVSGGLTSATVGKAYASALAVSGGTPSYTWSIAYGGLPSGLSLSATTGIISGTPTGKGIATFTLIATDSSASQQSMSVPQSITVAAADTTSSAAPTESSSYAPSTGTTWYVRPDGGTRYSTNVPAGQCDGKSNAAYPGKGVNQHCAFNDFRYMWDDQSYQSHAWVMAGGDTVIVSGCAANANQQNPSAPDCRIGFDAGSGTGAGYTWCYGGNGPYTCNNPTIPAGTPTQHTRILGANFASCSIGNVPDRSKMVQLVGGFGVVDTLDLTGTSNVDIQCLNITSHNNTCTLHGSPSFPKYCSTNFPLDDYDGNGIRTNSSTSNVLMQDVYVDGHTTAGIQGPIGGAITMNRVFVGFNGFAGWNFDDGRSTPNADGASITASYVTMKGNGCYQEYPLVHTDFPARACYDDLSGGFGDSWSGQDSGMASFTCDHCSMIYNTKDGFIGPHTQITNLRITNSESIGNMGQQWKWNNTTNATTVFENNLTIGGCTMMSKQLPGAAHSFALSSGLPGAYLSDFCRAAGDVFSFSSQANSNVLIANNTVVSYSNTVFDMNCGPAGGGAKTCGTTPFIYKNNIFLGYTQKGAEAPGLFYLSDPSVVVTSSNNLEYGVRNGDHCSGSILCVDPVLIGQPSQAWTDETVFYNFNFHPSTGSPVANHGVQISDLKTDYYGTQRPTPPSLGAVEP